MPRDASSRSFASRARAWSLDDQGEIAPASHVNFVIANGIVVMPIYGTATRRTSASQALQAACSPAARSSASPRAGCSAPARGRRVVPLHHPRGAALDDASAPSPSRPSRPPTVTTCRPISPRPKLWCARRRARARRSCCRRSCSRASTSRRGRTRNGSRPPTLLQRASVRCSRLRTLAKALKRGDPDFLLREGRAALLQQRGDRRCRRRDPRASIARATSPTGPAIRRNITSAPATPASRRGRRKPA